MARRARCSVVRHRRHKSFAGVATKSTKRHENGRLMLFVSFCVFLWLRNAGQAGRIIITADGGRAAKARDTASAGGGGEAASVGWWQASQDAGHETGVERIAGAGGVDDFGRRLHDGHIDEFARARAQERPCAPSLMPSQPLAPASRNAWIIPRGSLRPV